MGQCIVYPSSGRACVKYPGPGATIEGLRASLGRQSVVCDSTALPVEDQSRWRFDVEAANGIYVVPGPDNTVPRIKAEAQRRIIDLVIPPPDDQSDWMVREMNLHATFTGLSYKKMTVGVSEGEQNKINDLLVLWGKIQSIRTHSDTLEEDHTNGETIDVGAGTSASHPAGWPPNT